MMNGTLLLIIPLLFSYPQDQERSLDQLVQLGQTSLYEGSLNHAFRYFTLADSLYPTHPAGTFFLSLSYVWRFFHNPDSIQFLDSAVSYANRAVSLSDQAYRKEKNAGAILFWRGSSKTVRLASHYLKDAETHHSAISLKQLVKGIQTLYDRRSIINDLQTSIKNLPGMVDARLGIALLNLYEGSKDHDAIKDLWSVADSGLYFKVESLFLLTDFYFFNGSEDDLVLRSLPLCISLSAKYPRNFLFQLYLGKLYFEIGNIDTAKTIFTSLAKSTYNSIAAESEYHLGVIAEEHANDSLALSHFQQVINRQNISPKYLIPWSLVKSAECYERLGDIKLALDSFQTALRYSDVNGIQKIAKDGLQRLTK